MAWGSRPWPASSAVGTTDSSTCSTSCRSGCRPTPGGSSRRSPYADTREEAERQKRAFQAWCTKKGVAAVGQALERDWDRLVTFYDFPKMHGKHLRTSNPIESPFAAVRLRTAEKKAAA